MGCNGGWLAPCFSYWKTRGIVSGGLYGDKNSCQPYPLEPCAHHSTSEKYKPCPASGPTPRCYNDKCTATYSKSYKEDLTFAASAYSVASNENAIKTEIMKNGPVEAAFSVYEDFLTYKKGVYQHKAGSMLGGHAIKVVGWGVENGIPYWLIVNSWNESWGDNGIFKILRGKNHCGIESQVATGLPKL